MAAVDINAKYAALAGEVNDSKKDMIYATDDGTEYIVNISENIGEVMGFDDVVTADVGVVPVLPRGWKMRYIRFVDATGNVKGSYPVGKPDQPIYFEGGTVKVARKGKSDGVLCAVTGAIGETKRFGKAYDTGQQSGDDT